MFSAGSASLGFLRIFWKFLLLRYCVFRISGIFIGMKSEKRGRVPEDQALVKAVFDCFDKGMTPNEIVGHLDVGRTKVYELRRRWALEKSRKAS